MSKKQSCQQKNNLVAKFFEKNPLISQYKERKKNVRKLDVRNIFYSIYAICNVAGPEQYFYG